MNAATFWWVTYWLNVMLVLACDTYLGAMVAAVAAGLCIWGFATQREE